MDINDLAAQSLTKAGRRSAIVNRAWIATRDRVDSGDEFTVHAYDVTQAIGFYAGPYTFSYEAVMREVRRKAREWYSTSHLPRIQL